jgi:hypothetical protein
MTQPAADFEEPCPLVVPVEKIAIRLGLSQPLDDTSTEIITGAIYDAQAEVEGYLGRPITPTTFIETGRIAYPDGWRLRESKVISITSAEPEADPISGQPTGRYTITYIAGIDATQPIYLPVRRYIENTVLRSGDVVRLWQSMQGKKAQRVRSVSVEGQSISYEYLTPGGVESLASSRAQAGPQATNGAPTLKSLDRWRLAGRRVFIRPGRSRVIRL